MAAPRLHALFAANAAEIQRLQKHVQETVLHRDKSAEQHDQWKSACREFHSRYDRLAFPGGYSTAKSRITSGDADAIEAALCFVECRPYFFRSGYMFKEFLPKLKRANLTSDQKSRLEKVVSAYAAWRTKRRGHDGA